MFDTSTQTLQVCKLRKANSTAGRPTAKAAAKAKAAAAAAAVEACSITTPVITMVHRRAPPTQHFMGSHNKLPILPGKRKTSQLQVPQPLHNADCGQDMSHTTKSFGIDTILLSYQAF